SARRPLCARAGVTAPLEALDAAAAADGALLTGVGRVALRANLDLDRRARRAGLEGSPAVRARHCARSQLRMNCVLHCLSSFLTLPAAARRHLRLQVRARRAWTTGFRGLAARAGGSARG